MKSIEPRAWEEKGHISDENYWVFVYKLVFVCYMLICVCPPSKDKISHNTIITMTTASFGLSNGD